MSSGHKHRHRHRHRHWAWHGIIKQSLRLSRGTQDGICQTVQVVRASPGLELPASNPGPHWARLGLARGTQRTPNLSGKPQHWNHASLGRLIRPLTCCFTAAARLAPNTLAHLPAVPRACQDRCVHPPALLLGWPSLADKSFGFSDLTSSRSSTLTRASSSQTIDFIEIPPRD